MRGNGLIVPVHAHLDCRILGSQLLTRLPAYRKQREGQ